jgi:glycine amidinotransferase
MQAVIDRPLSAYLAPELPYQRNGFHSERRPIPVVNSFNEWDPLEEVIVGRVEDACIPEWHTMLAATMPASQHGFFQIYGGQKFAEELLCAAQRELEQLVTILVGEGITVQRPAALDWSMPFATPDFSQPAGLYAAMPRDFLLVVGDELIESPMAWRSRYFEFKAYRPLLKHYFQQGAKWTAAPKPELAKPLYNDDASLAGGEWVITEFEPVFDAADFMRCGRDIFCQKSHVTNQFGIDWLQRHLGDDYRIHVLDFDDPKAMHIDATFVPLAPGRLLLNATRATGLPAMFDAWEILTPPPPVIPDDHPLYFTSKWVSINVLSLDEERVVVEEQEEPLIRFLKNRGFQPIPVPFRNFMSLGGAFHCATVDVRRRGALAHYF